MSLVLAHAQFFGKRRREVGTESFAFLEADAALSADELPRHTHPDAHFVLVLRGRYITEARNRSDEEGPFTLIFNPGGSTHRDRFHDGPGRFFTISPTPGAATLLEAELPVSLVISQPAARRAAHGACRELRAAPASATTLEGLGLELIGSLSTAWADRTAGVPPWLRQAQEAIQDGCTSDLSVAQIAQAADVHPVHLARAFRRYLHVSPGEYLRRCRIQRARELLRSTARPLVEIALEVGFSEQSHFTHAFRRETGITPTDYRRLHR